MAEPKTITLPESDNVHVVGDKDCDECWGDYYPKPCEEHPGGLIHSSWGDENYDGDYWLYTKCDIGGE